MRYRLSTLLILAAVIPPVLAALVRFPRATIQWGLLIGFTIALACGAAVLSSALSGRE